MNEVEYFFPGPYVRPTKKLHNNLKYWGSITWIA